MPKVQQKRKPTKAEKRTVKARQIREADAVRLRTEAFLGQFSPEVQEHLKSEMFAKLEERRAQRHQQGASQ